VPPESVSEPGALADELIAIVGQHPDLHRLLVQERSREALHTLPERRAGDRRRVDRIGLPRLAATAPRAVGQRRRHPDDPLTVRYQRPLQPSRHEPTVLDRPHPLGVELNPEPQPIERPHIAGLNHALPADDPGRRIQRHKRVRPLVRVHPNHDHVHVPSLEIWPTERIPGGQTSVGANATLLSSHAGGPRAATGDKAKNDQTHTVDSEKASQPAADPRDLPTQSDITDHPTTIPLRWERGKPATGCGRSGRLSLFNRQATAARSLPLFWA
jgi:hypothetical protein